MTAIGNSISVPQEPGLESEERVARLPVGKSARSLADLVADRVLKDISAGHYKSGDRLKESFLSQEHAVSRATIRESLIALEKRGFVERIPRVGARVTSLQESDIDALYEARGGVLSAAAALCAERASEALRSRLIALAREMRQLADEGEPDPRHHAERAILIQQLIANGCGNRYLAEYHEHLFTMATSRLVRGGSLAFAPLSRRVESARDWETVARAIAAGKGEAAAAAVRALMERAIRAIREQLEAPHTSSAP
jgi:DNA-binding GntR family transcriptional regulator